MNKLLCVTPYRDEIIISTPNVFFGPAVLVMKGLTSLNAKEWFDDHSEDMHKCEDHPNNYKFSVLLNGTHQFNGCFVLAMKIDRNTDTFDVTLLYDQMNTFDQNNEPCTEYP